ncbi:MAG: amino acid ABC transporter substrate-binding protein [Gemmatimonadota bacterium]|nr:amino acid ABC transporter substrate-binding protein [Gemmatimonadota bacterium]
MRHVGSVADPGLRAWIAAVTLALIVGGALPALAQQPAAQNAGAQQSTLDRIRAAGEVRLGFRADAGPFSHQDGSGNPAGYSIDLCQRVVAAINAEPGMSSVTARWVPVTIDDRFDAVEQGRVDLLCGADAQTLARREQVSYSIPIFPGGLGALLRSDSRSRLRDVLSGEEPSYFPRWRASALQLLRTQTFAVVAGTTAEPWLEGRIAEFGISTEAVTVGGYDEGVQAVLDRDAAVFFGDRAILLDAAANSASADDLIVLDRFFTHEAVALALPRGDDDLRLLVDRTLSRFYASGDFGDLYARWFGEPNESVYAFFSWVTLPE